MVGDRSIFSSSCNQKDDHGSMRLHFLSLPMEIRAQILSYMLPYTLPPTTSQEVTWIRGSIAPLLVNQQLYAEAMDLFYGRNTFKLTVTYDGIRFCYSWRLPSGLRPNVTFRFPGDFSADALPRLRHVLVLVEHVDSYKGMIKYNCGGKGLSEGVRRQVQCLVDVLGQSRDGLGRVTIRLEGNAVLDAIRKRAVKAMEKYEAGGVVQSVLEPFGQLNGVGTPCVGGNVDTQNARELEEKLRSALSADGISPNAQRRGCTGTEHLSSYS